MVNPLVAAAANSSGICFIITVTSPGGTAHPANKTEPAAQTHQDGEAQIVGTCPHLARVERKENRRKAVVMQSILRADFSSSPCSARTAK
jgi:hypothetical protein